MPVIAGSDKVDSADEPGGSTCYNCHEDLEEGDHAYRVLFGKVDRTKEHDIGFGTTGGIVLRNWCQGCWRERRGRSKAAHYDVTDGDRLWAILEAADGDLVADMAPMLIGGRAWIRVVDGEVEARHAVTEKTDQGIRFDTEPTEGFDVDDFGQYFDDPGDRTKVLLKPVEETPFRDSEQEEEDSE